MIQGTDSTIMYAARPNTSLLIAITHTMVHFPDHFPFALALSIHLSVSLSLLVNVHILTWLSARFDLIQQV